ncbi:Mannan endo-1,6-alpha-mannosidase DCW1 [Neolecta irregularis DAH-3]|uniref:Mannan endo-1,6-alpha-mannosidase n=1 Tax=Neolecta irregularis (strain DAH-3) TaxID=1198029 RepID=A0A1U7LN34_NEOID|nr:Mannan endo-1,6-alpha-mannosidase DCW1 [Neolecta irregularis DAH-3]|eukprot:OLL24065.1 Mannan endo-1,6-alpha-mannosidase DCW1 [Neolecta irregularis DAH-3]
MLVPHVSLVYSLTLLSYCHSFTVDPTSQASLKSGATTNAAGLRVFYHGDEPGQIPGNFPYPTYWWQAGAAMNAWIDYRNYTGDSTYDAIVTQAMLFQVGPNNDYLPPNQTLAEGNDDQGFWGLAAMSAAERNFPNPPSTGVQWLALAQAVFNGQATRWDDANCGGGLRWQIFAFNNGYGYKNSISNGIFFQLGARLAQYTGNDTYAQWAEKAYNWTTSVKFLTSTYIIYDGADVPDCITGFDRIQWTYNTGMYLGGAAFMYTYQNQSSIWLSRVEALLDSSISLFFSSGTIVYEPACEPEQTCNDDQTSFKGYLARNMGYTAQLIPSLADKIFNVLGSSAVAVGKCCNGGTGTVCGNDYTKGTFDGHTGVGEAIAALEVIQAPLAKYASSPSSARTGGTSTGDVNAGTTSSSGHTLTEPPPTTAGKFSAVFVTILVSLSTFGTYLA